MKKTIVTLVHVASRLSKIMPVLLCLFLLSSSNLAAQSYLPLDDAVKEVKSELVDMPQAPQLISTSSITQDQMEDMLRKLTYEQFLKEAKTSNSTEAVYEIMEGYLNTQKMEEPRKSVAENVLQDLQDLITE
jgi:hypothetical protein